MQAFHVIPAHVKSTEGSEKGKGENFNLRPSRITNFAQVHVSKKRGRTTRIIFKMAITFLFYLLVREECNVSKSSALLRGNRVIFIL